MFDRQDNIFKRKKFEQSIAILQTVFPRNYCGDNMFVANRNMTFFDDEKFISCMNLLATGEPYTGMAWRMHTMIWAVKQAFVNNGAIVEFGTFRGFKIKFIMEYFGDAISERPVYVFDTFQGIDPRQSVDSPIKPEEHQKAKLFDFVKSRFRKYSNVTVVKGSAPESINKVDIKKIAFLHLDMNSWMAEIGTLDVVWDLIPSGGVVLLDDYGLYSHRAQKEHELNWFAQKNILPLELPTGQGIVIKSV